MAVFLTAIVCFATYAATFERTMTSQARSQCYLLKEICQESSDVLLSLGKVKNTFKGRITLVGFDGRVIFDSSFDEATLENHLERQEIATAIKDGAGSGKRYSKTDGKTNYYYALNIDKVGIVRVGIHSSQLLMESILPYILLTAFFMVLIFIFIIAVSAHTTKKIVTNILEYDFNGDNPLIYDELSPFINKINSQNKIINMHSEKNKAEIDKLESIFFNMKECIIVCDNFKIISETNAEAKRIFDINKGDNFYGTMRNAELNKNLQNALEGKTTHGILQQNGLSYQYTISPNIQNEVCTGAILIALDITEQTENQRMRREFTANVTHELKTPLTSILGYSQLVTSGIAKQSDILGFAQIIEKNAQSLLSLIDDIMQLSALDEGGKVSRQRLSFRLVVEDDITSLAPLIKEKGIRITKNIEDVHIIANLKHIGDISRNLISNAIKYNKQNGTVDITLKQEGDRAILIVSDTGIGIKKRDIDKVFERFYVADKSRNKSISSTGLGLSIVKHIVSEMGGVVSLRSTQGKGSTFTVNLPIGEK